MIMNADDFSHLIYTRTMHKVVQMVPAKVSLTLFTQAYAMTRICDDARAEFFRAFSTTRALHRDIARRIAGENMRGGFNSGVMGNPAFNAIVAPKKQDPRTW